jgi:hypothetical protein
MIMFLLPGVPSFAYPLAQATGAKKRAVVAHRATDRPRQGGPVGAEPSYQSSLPT